jgi:hypothetical protein
MPRNKKERQDLQIPLSTTTKPQIHLHSRAFPTNANTTRIDKKMKR